ncbi:MAG: dihydroneopterin aldolase [Phocaeicola sp.]|uniref:dihydroneopterin aldolase n=1 Tax=Phocaeicola sp. TaxID=2773926 RepID=UPI0023CB3D40|nr:dihydroneopterin aldolase [Phocaeicola sp.]MDE5677989.1 dihydroneopterin aldolase [Phocaeicola sp.]MDE6181050.1 dihydroneopterin aldolase [Phocaeicola sp.]
MKATSMYIYLEGIKLFCFHGVDPQETAVGAYFLIDLKLKTDFARAARTDELEGTINYADVYATVKEEMKIPSCLLEHVCERIGKRLFNDFPAIEEIDLRLSKENPPMGSDCQNVGIEVHYIR